MTWPELLVAIIVVGLAVFTVWEETQDARAGRGVFDWHNSTWADQDSLTDALNTEVELTARGLHG